MTPKEIVCPDCGRILYTDSNNNLYADCPWCFRRIYFEVGE